MINIAAVFASIEMHTQPMIQKWDINSFLDDFNEIRFLHLLVCKYEWVLHTLVTKQTGNEGIVCESHEWRLIYAHGLYQWNDKINTKKHQ